MEPSHEIRRALATISTALEDLTPEAPLSVNDPSFAEVDEARRALGVLCRFFGVDIEL
jgi:hypothetical protein